MRHRSINGPGEANGAFTILWQPSVQAWYPNSLIGFFNPRFPFAKETWDEPGVWDFKYHNFMTLAYSHGYPYGEGIIPGSGYPSLNLVTSVPFGSGVSWPITDICASSTCWQDVYMYCRRDIWSTPYKSRSRPPANPLADRAGRAMIKDPFDRGFTVWYLVRDLLELFETLTGIGELLDALTALGDFAGYVNSRPRLNARDLASADITYQFGITNLVRDIGEFVGTLKHWRSHYDSVLSGMHRLRTARFAPQVLDDYGDSKTFYGTRIISGQTLNLRVEVKRDAGVFHRTLLYNYTAPEFMGVVARLKQFVDAFGILDTSAMWDGIVPFSFILDWFFGIRDWLHKNVRPRLYPADVVARDYCESIALDYTATWFCDWRTCVLFDPGTVMYTDLTNQALFRESYRSFSRRRWNPPRLDGYSFPEVKSSFVNLRRVNISANLAALLASPRG